MTEEDKKLEGVEPVAWMYEFSGVVEVQFSSMRNHGYYQGWTETPLYSATALLPLFKRERDDWFAGDVDCDGNELVTIRAYELQKLRDERDKFMWQVRDTCARAEKAEAELAATRNLSTEGEGE